MLQRDMSQVKVDNEVGREMGSWREAFEKCWMSDGVVAGMVVMVELSTCDWTGDHSSLVKRCIRRMSNFQGYILIWNIDNPAQFQFPSYVDRGRGSFAVQLV